MSVLEEFCVFCLPSPCYQLVTLLYSSAHFAELPLLQTEMLKELLITKY